MTELTNNFDYLQSFINEMKESSSGNHKIATIKKYADNSEENEDREFLQNIFYYTYNPYFKYNVTSKNCKKNSDLLGHPNTYGSIFPLSDDLRNSDFLFTQLGSQDTSDAMSFGADANSNNIQFIDSTIRVTGLTTGYRLDVPIRFIKKKTV